MIHQLPEQDAGKRQRNPSVEFLRVLLMFLIVLHHTALYGVFRNDVTHPVIPILFTVLIYWHVDAFIAITGWFGTRLSLTRVAKITGVMLFYSLLSSIYVYCTKGMLRFSIAGGWFCFSYLAFLLLVPIVNAAIDSLKGKRLLVAVLALNLCAILNWILFNGKGKPFSVTSFSVLPFLLVYFNVRAIRKSGVDVFIRLKHLCFILLLFIAGALISSIIPRMLQFASGMRFEQKAWLCWNTYDAMHVYLMGIAIVCLFAKFVHLPSRVSNVVARLAPCTFGVFVAHETTAFGHDGLCFITRLMADHCVLNPLLIILTSAFLCFVACVAIENVRRLFVRKLANSLLNKLDYFDTRILR